MEIIEIDYEGEIRNREKLIMQLQGKYPELKNAKIKFSTRESGSPVIRIKTDLEKESIAKIVRNFADTKVVENPEKEKEKGEREMGWENIMKNGIHDMIKESMREQEQALEEFSKAVIESKKTIEETRSKFSRSVEKTEAEMNRKAEKVIEDSKAKIDEIFKAQSFKIAELEAWQTAHEKKRLDAIVSIKKFADSMS